MSQALAIRHFPLRGSQLIEASAGTGKTFTIALLYIRLVLQHGVPAATTGSALDEASIREHSAFARALLPEEILVVTFTEAATQELRERIRARLAEAARCFLEPDETHDPLLVSLRDDYPAADWIGSGRLLALAAQNMDQAAIATIHGWCYRMLREHAFDSGSLFQQTLVPDLRDIHAELIRDYWRHAYYALSDDLAELVTSEFTTPDDLLKTVLPLLHPLDTVLTLSGRTVSAPEQLDTTLRPFAERRRRLLDLDQKARRSWLSHRAELEQLMDQLRPRLNRTRYREAKDDADFLALKQALYDWAEGGAEPGRLERFAAGNWGFTGKPPPEQPSHPALDALAALMEEQQQQDDADDVRGALILHCAHWLEQALLERQQRRAELGFDDLLRRLDQALSGPQGEPLAAQIREQFPVAMIDEFQDTDLLQYRIFDRIYHISENRRDSALILIGDPKQAIYSFRSADIHTYLAARRATAGRHHHLQRNYRSTSDLVGAVNTLFGTAEQWPAGAFRFRQGDDNPLPFMPVSAHGRNQQLALTGAAQPALTVWHLHPDNPEQAAVGLTAYRNNMALVCAQRIATLLQEGVFIDDDSRRAVQPRDVAILVRSRSEAELIRAALRSLDLASVFLSDRESVFASQEASDVLLWLQACADPMHERKVRTALATQTLERSLGELKALYQDEDFWEETCELFRALHRCWQRRGVLPMLRQLLHDLDLPQRLLAAPGGDRRLTNLLHLAEYLQRASVEHDGELALIRHLRERINNPGDEEILRLENDADLIRVVTIHKSKGLEYPLVFVPFAAAWKPVDGNQKHVRFMDGEHGRRLEFGSAKGASDAWEQADNERLAEDLRLFYVAATRATHALWLSVAALAPGNAKHSRVERSAFGYLLGGGEPLDQQGLAQRLSLLQQHSPAIAVISLVSEDIVAAAEHPPQPVVQHQSGFRPARRTMRHADDNWWIASYSALQTTASNHQEIQPAAAREEQAIEEATTPDTVDVTPVVAGRHIFSRSQTGLHGFHRGPGPGTFLHGLLELAAAQGFDPGSEASSTRLAAIEQRCRTRGWDAEVTRLHPWLDSFLMQPFALPEGGPLTLAKLSRFRVELEFMFPVHHVDTLQLDALCQAHLLPGQTRPALQAAQLNGMVKGFVDLVAEHEGRFQVVDWKSNYLGPNDSYYTAEALTAEILHHRYDVQYALYLLALHRSLRTRMVDYNYQQHLGGVCYFFLRGWQAPTQGLFHTRPAPEFIEQLDRLFGND